MGSEAEKDTLFEAIALMGKAFASPRRLELLDLLAQAPRNVDELSLASGQSTANTSQHLQALHAAGLVTRVREGTSVRYALAGDRALGLWLTLRGASVSLLAEADREVVAYCRGPLCAYAHDAVRQLQAAGVRARRLEDGWPEWQLAEKSNKRRRAA